MKNVLYLQAFILVAFFSIIGCKETPTTEESTENSTQIDINPPAEGFNEDASDSLAMAIADEVMEAMGGRQAWDQTRHFAWDFFGARRLVWDKQLDRVRIETPSESKVVLLDMKTMEGTLVQDGEEMTNPDSLKKYLDQAYGQWINDSYWLVMPFKLKDSGVTLTYAGEDSTMDGALADVLRLTFEDVGKTPQNRYDVYVDKDTRFVSQWDYYPEASDEAPRFSTLWKEYNKYGQVYLSGDRGKLGDREMQLDPIYVLDSIPETAYSSTEDWMWEDLENM